MRKIVLLVGAMLAVLVLTMAGPVSKHLVSPRPVEAQLPSPEVIVENGKGADNARIQRAINNAQGKRITIGLRPGSQEAGTCYSIAGHIDLASNVTIDSAGSMASVDAPNWCMERATPPRTGNSIELRWFRVIGDAVNNFTLRNANLYGGGPGDVSLEEQQSFVEYGLVFNQRIKDPQNPSLYSKHLTLEDVTFDKFYGVCVFTKYVDGIMFEDVVCDDPTKGGLIFTYGTRNGSISDSAATRTGDDAMAFTSGASAPGSALVTNIAVDKATLSQEVDATGCGSLCIRGASDILTTSSSFGSGGVPGSVGITHSVDSAHAWNSSNITIDGTFAEGSLVSTSIIRPDSDQNGVIVDDPNPANIQITDNSIYYAPPQNGIRISRRTPISEVLISGNTFEPDGANNVCVVLPGGQCSEPITSAP